MLSSGLLNFSLTYENSYLYILSSLLFNTTIIIRLLLLSPKIFSSKELTQFSTEVFPSLHHRMHLMKSSISAASIKKHTGHKKFQQILMLNQIPSEHMCVSFLKHSGSREALKQKCELGGGFFFCLFVFNWSQPLMVASLPIKHSKLSLHAWLP